MELKDIISEGKIDREGMKNIQYLIDENDKLKEAFVFIDSTFALTRYYSKSQAIEKYIKLYQLQITTEKELKRIVDGLREYLNKRILIKTKDILKIINNE